MSGANSQVLKGEIVSSLFSPGLKGIFQCTSTQPSIPVTIQEYFLFQNIPVHTRTFTSRSAEHRGTRASASHCIAGSTILAVGITSYTGCMLKCQT